MASDETGVIAAGSGEVGSRGLLTFDWSRHRVTHWRLGVFILLSLGIHGIAFYLFQVVYPQPERFSPVPARVTMLMSDDPAVRGVLRGVEDRVIYFDAGTRETALGGSLEGLSLKYEPSYLGYRPKIRKPLLGGSEGEGLGMIPLELPEALRGGGDAAGAAEAAEVEGGEGQ
ncbi:MAG: hypothetical protein AAF591_06615 [Verrucomicrobiota bacterium]